MSLLSRPLLLIVLELAWFLLVLQTGGSPFGTDLPVAAAAVALVVGLVAIAVLLGTRRFERCAWRVEGGLGALMVVVGLPALVTTSPDPVANAGLAGVGVVLVLEAIARRWPRAP